MKPIAVEGIRLRFCRVKPFYKDCRPGSAMRRRVLIERTVQILTVTHVPTRNSRAIRSEITVPTQKTPDSAVHGHWSDWRCDGGALPAGAQHRRWCAAVSGSPPRGTIVYLHGVADNRTSGDRVVARYTAQGYEVIAYDSRAHGDSQGTMCTNGFFEKQRSAARSRDG